jgi:hypothetical protein
MTSGVAIEKSVFSKVPRWSGPSEVKSMRSWSCQGLSIKERRWWDIAVPEEKVLTSGVLLRNDHGDPLNLDSAQTSGPIECYCATNSGY